MTDEQIKETILAIKRATRNACKSRASARKFLKDAGILMEYPDEKLKRKKK